MNQFSRWVFLQFLDKKKTEKFKIWENARQAGNAYLSRINGLKLSEIYITGDVSKEEMLCFAEGMALGNYQFLKYKGNAKKSQNALKKIFIVDKNISSKDVEYLNISVEATCMARTWVNEPLSYLTATKFADEFKKASKKSGFKITVFNKAKIKALKMGGLLAVNLGSIDPPTFSIMEWKPKNAVNKKPIVLVGKGVVYDTGGLSLKPTANSMDFMKCDMGGGATVGGAMYAVAKAKLPVHLVGLVPATDNRPDGNAYAPGDVITMYSGKTVEVLNTDAEGRMIMADALHYAKKYKPELVMDFATLTGAAAAAIGPVGVVCMGTADEKVKDKLKESGGAVHERLAELPFWDEYGEMIKSDLADIKNLGGPYGGAITAGKFLEHFTDYPYMHFDIAGMAYLKGKDSYRGKNGTGVGVRLLFDYFRKLAKK
ncbi:MAG: leucyl aminopeptidase family protein [Bacteroidia bacterium]|nr:leucyl aminopeptidase family protein [Bacteroidia bacterium]NNM16146.1 leucyl aminopeptidase family protein [Bacteroidia bacterium]